LPDSSEEAKEAQKYYGWTNKLNTTAYELPESQKKKNRTIVANLFVGEWVKIIKKGDTETEVKFRGGTGYVPNESIGSERTLEIYFIDVGQGDSILIQTPDDKRILIDGGKNKSAHSFLKWKYHLGPVEQKAYTKDFEAIIMTHGDSDHLAGLLPVLESEYITVKRIYHNGLATREKKPTYGEQEKFNNETMLVELYEEIEDLTPIKDKLTSTFKKWVEAVSKAKEQAINRNQDFKCIRADQNTEPLIIGNEKPLKITFLNPINFGTKTAPRLMDFGDDGETINGNSVGVLLEYGKAKILLCGDMNEKADTIFLQHTNVPMPIAQVFKASHHGSQYFTTDFLKAVQPWMSVVSAGDNTYGHPTAILLGSLGHYAPNVVEKPLVFATQVAATFKRVTVNSKKQGPQLYEKTTYGLVNVRTNGEWLAIGRVYKAQKRTKNGKPAKSLWDWEKYAFDLKNAKTLTNNLLEEK
jgi:beta-lactamase superfamily II metal-dependent hydrolase